MKIITAKTVSPFPVAIVISRFNEEITELLFQKAKQRFQELNFPEQLITTVWVPGALEIPITAQRLAITKQYDAIICLGTVIQGDTHHFNSVCNQVNYGCQRVALTQNIPVIQYVLMTDTDKLAKERINRGSEAVDAAARIISVLKQLQ